MSTYYRIMLPNGGGKAYSNSRVVAEELADLAASNGYPRPTITKMTRLEIPNSNIPLVAGL